MTRQQHRLHGDPSRFDVLASFIYDRFGNSIQYIADVAGGQGMLTRILNKKYNYKSEVVDPRGWVLKGVPNRSIEYKPDDAIFYDLIVGLHPDEATKAVVYSAHHRPTIIVPCCNFWAEEKLGTKELLFSIERYYTKNCIQHERIHLNFRGPKNIALVTTYPRGNASFTIKPDFSCIGEKNRL